MQKMSNAEDIEMCPLRGPLRFGVEVSIQLLLKPKLRGTKTDTKRSLGYICAHESRLVCS